MIDEAIIGGPWLVMSFGAGLWERLTDMFRGSKMYGHFLVTSRRIAYLREFPSGKVREAERSLVFSGEFWTEGWERYQREDLIRDLEHRANLAIPLEQVLQVRTSGKDGSTLEIDYTSDAGSRRLRFYKVGQLQRGPASTMPMPSREPMVDVAEAIAAAMQSAQK